MNRFEKIAWYNLAVLTISLLLFLVLFSISRTTHPFNISLKRSFAAFALCGFCGLGPFLFKKKQGSEDTGIDGSGTSDTVPYDPELDERDMLIQRRALLHGFKSFWFIFVFFVMSVWIYLRYISPSGTGYGPMSITIDVDILPLMLFPGFLLLMFAYSLSTILQYRSKALGDNISEIGSGPGRRTVVSTLASLFFFSAFSIFMLSFMKNWMFAVKFLMIGFATAHLSVRTLRYNPSGNYSEGDIRLLKIAEWTARGLFFVFYLASIGSVVIQYRESGSISVIIRLFTLGFGTLIFLMSILKYGDKHPLEDRHEQA